MTLLGGNTGPASSGIFTSDSRMGGLSSDVPGLTIIGFSGLSVGGLSPPISVPGCVGLSPDVPGLPRGGLSCDSSLEDGLSPEVSGLLGGGLSSNLGGLVCGLSEVPAAIVVGSGLSLSMGLVETV